jgi:hypothetical protein
MRYAIRLTRSRPVVSVRPLSAALAVYRKALVSSEAWAISEAFGHLGGDL